MQKIREQAIEKAAIGMNFESGFLKGKLKGDTILSSYICALAFSEELICSRLIKPTKAERFQDAQKMMIDLFDIRRQKDEASATLYSSSSSRGGSRRKVKDDNNN